MKKVAVLLAGCGVYDGSEIHEAVCTLLALDRKDLAYECVAPDMAQMHVVDHLQGEPVEESREVLVESARIARGEIRSLDEVAAEEYDGLVIPGGFGAAKNLCDFAVRGAECEAREDVARFILAFHEAGKPIAAACIAPALVARVLGRHCEELELTIGRDAATAAGIEAMGGRHVNCDVQECHVDQANRVVTTPAYMLAGRISEAATGIEAMVAALALLMG